MIRFEFPPPNYIHVQNDHEKIEIDDIRTGFAFYSTYGRLYYCVIREGKIDLFEWVLKNGKYSTPYYHTTGHSFNSLMTNCTDNSWGSWIGYLEKENCAGCKV